MCVAKYLFNNLFMIKFEETNSIDFDKRVNVILLIMFLVVVLVITLKGSGYYLRNKADKDYSSPYYEKNIVNDSLSVN